MDKETLSNYGWIVICVLVLSVMIALATPFGGYVADGFKAAYKGFGDTNTEVTDMMYSAVGTKVPASCGIEGHYKGDNRGTHGIPTTDCTKGHRYTCECINWVVPEGGTYKMNFSVNGKSVYNAGEALPNHYLPSTGDIYEYGDYKYTYRYDYSWSVEAKDKTKTEYGEILSEIVGKPTTNMSGTFLNCTSLTTAPTIPSSVTNMQSTFYGCTSLTTAPTIPSRVTNMQGTFSKCTSLTTAPAIPNSVTSMYYTFSGCTSLTTAPVIPNSVTDIAAAFYGCTSLEVAPIIPSGVEKMGTASNYSQCGIFQNCTSLKTYVGSTDPDGDFSKYVIPNTITNMNNVFRNCKKLTKAPVIPNSLTDMAGTFSGCTSLTTAPTIPNSVTDMSGTFLGCTSITTAPEIPNSVTDMDETFMDCTSLTTAPTIPNGVTDMTYTFYNCGKLTTAPAIPSSVTNMKGTFYYCTSLTGTIEINANPTEYDICFYGTSKPIILTGSSTMLSQIAGGKSNITIQ